MKVSVIGAGAVGGQLAFCLALDNHEDIVLIDIQDGLAAGKALDIMESAPLLGFTGKVSGSQDFSALAGSDITVMTAGVGRKPGMSREDLLGINLSIVGDVADRIREHAPGTILIMVTNPLDLMSYAAYIRTGFEAERVIGMAGVLDSARYRYFISEAAGTAPSDTDAMILGPHGDGMVVTSRASARGKSLDEVFESADLERLRNRARNGGKEIVDLLKNSSAHFAPAASAAKMVRAISGDTGEVMPCSVLTRGSYGLPDVFTGLPVRLGKGGVKEIAVMDFKEDELASLAASAGSIEETLKKLKLK